MTTLRRVMVSKYITHPMRSEDTDAARGISGRSISNWEEVGEAVFHGFGVDFEESSTGFGNYSTAIVEWPTGQVEMVRADKIRFIDPIRVGVDKSENGDRSVTLFATLEGGRLIIRGEEVSP